MRAERIVRLVGVARELKALGHDRDRLAVVLVQRHDRRHAHGRHARQRRRAFAELAIERLGLRGVVAGKPRIEARKQHALGPESGLTELGSKRAAEIHGHRQQHERECDLSGDESVAAPEPGEALDV